MKAYKFLTGGATGRFSDFRWPVPTDDGLGDWVEAGEALEDCRTGVHACTPRQLLDWIDDELWEIELDGEIVEGDAMIVAQRGRLLGRIDAWNDRCEPFVWTKTADEILKKARPRKKTSDTRH